MRSSHAAATADVVFDDPNLIADAGLVQAVGLAERIGLPGLIAEQVRMCGAANSGGANPAAKVMTLLVGMIAGPDSIDDVDRLRIAGMAAYSGRCGHGSSCAASNRSSPPPAKWTVRHLAPPRACSPPARARCCRPRHNTAHTRSSSRPSPMPSTPRWPARRTRIRAHHNRSLARPGRANFP